MKIKNYMPLIVAGGIVIVLLVLEAFLLIRLQTRHAAVQRDLASADSNIRSLMRRDPFPSEQNVEVMQSNLEKLDAQLSELQDWMMEGQIEYDELRVPNDFMIKLATDLRGLRAAATARGVQIPADFYFSFRRYAEGDMCAMRHVGRLSRQLQMIGVICDILFEGRIHSIEAIARQEFDVAGRSDEESAEDTTLLRGRTRVETVRPPSQQREASYQEHKKPEVGYAWEEFRIDFTVREPAFWDIIHMLSTTNLLISVKDVSFESTDRAVERTRTPATRRGATARVGADAARGRLAGSRLERVAMPDEPTMDGTQQVPEPEDVPREERVVAGDGILRVSMTLNMYRFLDD